jgi:hypothetical protein
MSTFSATGHVAQGEWNYELPVRVIPGSLLQIELAGIPLVPSGNPDLFVKFGDLPTSASASCISNSSTANEACILTVPTNQTLAFIGVRGVAASNLYTLTARNVLQPGAAFTYSGMANFPNSSSELSAGELRRYLPLKVNPGDHYKVTSTGAGDVDLFVRFNSEPGTLPGTYSCARLGTSANTCEGVVPSDGDQLYIMVRGNTSSTYTLEASY